ncbi:MAG: cyclase family protein [Candidatus Hydrogenedentes bacterium]|nr:cyclase family protein [Candidatus Hydrogenedentota bacterium]
MVFDIDFNKYRLVDLSLEVVPNQTDPYRPFEVRPGRLGDGTHKFDIINTHTHVGTHIESPWHFYGKGNTCTDYPLEKFMGRTILLKSNPSAGQDRICLADVKQQLESRRGTFKILYVRNDSGQKPLRFDMECIPYFAELGLNLFIFDSTIEFGQGLEDGRKFHDLLMSRDVLFIEFPNNSPDLDRDEFFVFALPLKIKNLDSSACRLLAILER